MCDCEDLTVYMLALLHGNEMYYIASGTDTLTPRTTRSLWSVAEVLILLFDPVGISSALFFSFILTVSLPSIGFQFSCFFVLSYRLNRFKSLFLSLDLGTKRQEHSIARCTCPDWSAGILSTQYPCLCSDGVALFEIASCKDNCTSRCCNKLMTGAPQLWSLGAAILSKTDDFSNYGSSKYVCVKWKVQMCDCTSVSHTKC